MSSRVPASPVQLACWDTGYSRPACWSASASTRAARHLWRSAVRESYFRYFKDDQFLSDLFLRFFYLCPCVWLPAVQGWFCSVFPLLLNSFIKKKNWHSTGGISERVISAEFGRLLPSGGKKDELKPDVMSLSLVWGSHGSSRDTHVWGCPQETTAECVCVWALIYELQKTVSVCDINSFKCLVI